MMMINIWGQIETECYLVLLRPVVDRVSVPGVSGGGAGAPRAPALLLHPRASVGVNFSTHREGGANGEV